MLLKKKNRNLVCVIMAIIAMMCLVGCERRNNNKTFCEIVSEITGESVILPKDAPYGFTIGADDSYCEIDTNPYDIDDYSSPMILSYIKQMNELLELPSYLFNDMLHTSYSQGKQEEVFEKFKVKYYYHPDKGLNVSYYRIVK